MMRLDLARLCVDHIGEVHPPRCAACDETTARLVAPRRKNYIPLSQCALHRGYPMPCDRCERDNQLNINYLDGTTQ